MKKLLKIHFWKAEKALAMQIFEQEGSSKCKEEGEAIVKPALSKYDIDLSVLAKWDDLHISYVRFDTNAERDEYLQKIVSAITDELFTGEGELKGGEICEVWNSVTSVWVKRKLLAILPSQYEKRFITEIKDLPTKHTSWSHARPIVRSIEPKVEECGQLVTYTWEE